MTTEINLVTTPEDLLAHEKALYHNFYCTYPAYSEQFFTLVNSKRLRPKIPYDSQLIYGIKHNGILICAGSFCIDQSIRFEIEDMGFHIEKTPSVVEGLHFYSTLSRELGLYIEVYRKLLLFSFNDLLTRNYTTIYSSCSERLIKLYRYIGFEIINDIQYHDEREFLLKFDLTCQFADHIFKLDRMIASTAP